MIYDNNDSEKVAVCKAGIMWHKLLQVHVCWRVINLLFNHSNVCTLQEYRILFEESGNSPGDKTLEDKFFEHEVSIFCLIMNVLHAQYLEW